MKNVDLTNRKFSKLTALNRQRKDGTTYYVCLCECGNKVTIRHGNLTSGQTKSYGCLLVEMLRKRNFVHGERRTRLYKTWHNMISRCENKNDKSFKNYGGRGIKVCKNWQIYKNFSKWAKSNGYTDDLMIDRINNNSNYSPSNCRWTNRQIQNNNKRNNIKFKNETARQASLRLGGCIHLVQSRIYSGWTVHKAFTTPVCK